MGNLSGAKYLHFIYLKISVFLIQKSTKVDFSTTKLAKKPTILVKESA